jgi:hypothetical protein
VGFDQKTKRRTRAVRRWWPYAGDARKGQEQRDMQNLLKPHDFNALKNTVLFYRACCKPMDDCRDPALSNRPPKQQRDFAFMQYNFHKFALS